MIKHTLMVQGTTSDAGKSALVTGICRAFRKRNLKVAPFKPQNMALNSAVTIDGGEIGRAQAVQAQACGLEPHTDFNPILLKPNSDQGAQVIIHGHAVANMNARSYHNYKSVAMEAVLASHQRLSEQFDLICVEGAGSPAEINLRDKDIANMGFAEAVDCPVILVADIDRGGVFAHLVGTLELLSPSERQRVIGMVINRFRGDISLLQPGIDWLEDRTGIPVLGTLPYLHNLHLEAEDGLSGKFSQQASSADNALRIVIPQLPHISNHTDFEPLRFAPQVTLEFAIDASASAASDLIILPGSKNVRADLAWLKENGWDQHIQRHLRYGGKVFGICGGYQMLGQHIHDPEGIETTPGSSEGLGYLDIETTLTASKQLTRVSGVLTHQQSLCTGYEIHAGISRGPGLEKPFVQLDNSHADGAISEDDHVAGTYLHGIFDKQTACQSILEWAGLKAVKVDDYEAIREHGIDRITEAVEQHLDLEKIAHYLTSSSR